MNVRMGLLGITAFVLAAVAGLVTTHSGVWGTAAPSPHSAARSQPPALPGEAAIRQASGPRRPYVGVAAVRTQDLRAYEQMTGIRPGIVEFYQGFGDPYPTARARAITGYGAIPFVELSPRNAGMTAVVAGSYDGYLRKYADAIKRVGYTVAVSFAPEANGTWYSWGCHHTDPAVFVAAWRHVHDVLARSGAHNIIWIWVVNTIYHGSCPLAERWPGKRYVDWIGIDGHFRGYRKNFSGTFGPTLSQVGEITHKPFLISETGVLNGPLAQAEIISLFRGLAKHPEIVGMVYFNYIDKRGSYRLQDDPAELAAFRREARRFMDSRSPG